ncbi:MAG: sulfatase [Verrucomicrobiota bacterium]
MRSFLLLFVFTAFCGCYADTTTNAKLNIIVLLVDDLGWGDFGAYGAQFYETPHIDRLAAGGMTFRNAYAACTVCSPSRAALLTGQYPARLRLTDWIAGHRYPYARLSVPDWNMRIEHERTLLPEAFQQAGYQTAFIGKWHLMPIGQPDFDQHYPTDHGFGLNIGGREWGQPKGRGKYFSPFDMPNLNDGESGDFLTDKLTDAALQFLEESTPEKPFLLYFSYYTLHSPIMCPPELKRKYQAKLKTFENTANEHLDPGRAGMVESLDNSVGRIMDKLEALGIAENTIIILTGDNGGDYDKTTGGLKGYKAFAHEGGTRVPMIIKWPDHTAPGSISDAVVIGTDLYPTLLDAAGLELRPKEHIDGISIAPVLENGAVSTGRDAIYWHYPHYHRTKPYGAIRKGDWKLIEFFEDGELELYHLATDPNETNNISAEQPEQTSQLLSQLKDWRKSVNAQLMSPNPDYDPEHAESKHRKK